MATLRVGYVPEHFSTPLNFAQTHFSLSAKLVPFPSGTGHMVAALHAGELDIAIGLTEGWITAIAKASTPNQPAEDPPNPNEFKLVGTYVQTPLCWTISTGHERDDINSTEDLKGKKVGVSRIGSGSYIMSFVLADREGWLQPSSTDPPFEPHALQTFESLRKGVNDKTADFFMWEYFTSKRYYNSESLHPIKKVGEIYTPWSSWKIVARNSFLGSPELDSFLEKVDSGVEYFKQHEEEAVLYISTELDYEEEDAREWMKTVKFPRYVRGVSRDVVRRTVDVLQKAGVVGKQWEDRIDDDQLQRFIGL
ncbi:MAG: hypothetical protein L6R40_004579 [Gallowayella cf. fulva]|nr:MAG: hypothetical protein L6R40_004579 [Xanthomendoza cf. fulva]